MTDLPRLKPEPVPAIHPVPEYAVEGRRKDWYEDMKARLQVPWMGVVTMAFAHYPRFFETLCVDFNHCGLSRPALVAVVEKGQCFISLLRPLRQYKKQIGIEVEQGQPLVFVPKSGVVAKQRPFFTQTRSPFI